MMARINGEVVDLTGSILKDAIKDGGEGGIWLALALGIDPVRVELFP